MTITPVRTRTRTEVEERVNTETFTHLWGQARERVLSRYAAQAREQAQRLRDRAHRFPEEVASIESVAAELKDYADRCEAAAADPSLPTPTYSPN